MSNVLEKIVADKRLEINQLKQRFPLERFANKLQPSERSFYRALAQPNAGFIFECKKASPSKGLIRADFDLDEIIQAYGPDAACISVLTDKKYFQGDFEYLSYMRDRVSQPVLNKDFFIEPYQIHLARHHQADAVLLMLSVLNDQQYLALAELAEHYQLDILTEVSNEEEVARALALKARIIGINNRNLRDLSTDLATTEKLVPLIRASGHECLIISESGIYTNQDVRRLAPLVDGFLVGSSLMAEQDLQLAVKKLLYGNIKICGITRVEDAKLVRQLGATQTGLIFAKKSKRCLSLPEARQIVAQVPHHYVGVFADNPIHQLVAFAKALGLYAVQLHGKENQLYINQLREALPEQVQIWKALGVQNKLPAMDLQQVDTYLLDCQVGAQSGGTGQSFDWRLLAEIEDRSGLILAGGLCADNIQPAIEVGTMGLDVNSGVESAPGIKDENKLKQLFELVRCY